MAVYPPSPVPASVQMATLLDPFYEFESDQGYSIRRSKHSRPRRRYQLDYLGMTTQQTRFIRDFLLSQRLGVTTFEWIHPTAFDTVPVSNTTPVFLTYFHEYVTGQWVVVSGATPNTSLNGAWPVQRHDPDTLSLTGTVAGGESTCQVRTYLPRAMGYFPDGEMPSPAKLMGPESINSDQGRFSFSVLVEEIF